MGIGLPGTRLATAQAAASGTVVYTEAKGAVDTAAQISRDGSVSALVTLKDAAAPSEYRFPLDLPEGAHAVVTQDGGVAVADSSGELIGTFSTRWAKDANHADVPTSYRRCGAGDEPACGDHEAVPAGDRQVGEHGGGGRTGQAVAVGESRPVA
ncbi:hypothetical protein C6N75_02915 [Streptomyces solincola]|uniref:Uncharacterized protein n=1 Tax=Streptomyces solincola TaxID=2100817 RepID=A0A2S9Q1T1_9ACTN|nr:hypothetical protein [Streptomyces solincola]PRH80645.1 hypothetical protein C6N75_02915 [Streptomyces solincola]